MEEPDKKIESVDGDMPVCLMDKMMEAMEKTKEADTDHTASQSRSSGRNEERSESEGEGRQRLKP